MLENIAQKNYIYIFTSLEIVFLKKFKNCILDQTFFINCLYLFIINEIHLIEEWDKNFQSIYAEIEKVQKRIPCYIFLLYISATLTKSV